MGSPSDQDSKGPSLQDRAFGALIGLAIGDSLGDQARSPENHTAYGITRDLRENLSWSTDDTEFALLVAYELIAAGGELSTEIVVRFWEDYVLSQGDLGTKGGESEKGAAANLRRGILPPLSGSDNSFNDSDGAAMRVTPIGIMCAGNPDRAARLAEIDACISHARDGIWGAQAMAASVAAAMAGASVAEVVATGRQYIPSDSWLGRWFDRAMSIVEASCGDLDKAWHPLHDGLWTQYRASVAEALAEVYAIFRLTDGNFVEGVIAAANFGRDADTLAALVGALSGAMHGAGPIPPAWIEKTRRPAGRCLRFSSDLDIAAVAQQLVHLIHRAP
jgi:ADP-ribosylglycohydrolase